ncbi:hypothetical protein Trydic_g2006 [Trypoxylus dichotomus]
MQGVSAWLHAKVFVLRIRPGVRKAAENLTADTQLFKGSKSGHVLHWQFCVVVADYSVEHSYSVDHVTSSYLSWIVVTRVLS